MAGDLHHVFVYGTLLVGEGNHHVAEPFLQRVREGTVRGQLYNVVSYPALVLDDQGQQIVGEWFSVTEEGLRRMDWLEGYSESSCHNHYERVWVNDDTKQIEGFVYIYTKEKARGLELIKSGSWREFSKKLK